MHAWTAHPYRLGPELPTPRGNTQASVSASFERRELALVLMRAQQFGPSGILSEFSCGDSVPELTMSVELRPGGEYEERRVILDYLPRLDDKNECLDRGVDYLSEDAVRGDRPWSADRLRLRQPIDAKAAVLARVGTQAETHLPL